MKASKFSDAQKAFILKQGKDGGAVADIACSMSRAGNVWDNLGQWGDEEFLFLAQDRTNGTEALSNAR